MRLFSRRIFLLEPIPCRTSRCSQAHARRVSNLCSVRDTVVCEHSILDMCRSSKESILFGMNCLHFVRRRLMTVHGRLARCGMMKVADTGRALFIREIKNKIKQSLIQQETWRELLEIDNLTINGIVILKDGQLSRGHHFRHRK